jgi:hypothetical protein
VQHINTGKAGSNHDRVELFSYHPISLAVVPGEWEVSQEFGSRSTVAPILRREGRAGV